MWQETSQGERSLLNSADSGGKGAVGVIPTCPQAASEGLGPCIGIGLIQETGSCGLDMNGFPLKPSPPAKRMINLAI